MGKNLRLSKEIEALIRNPPRHWRALSQALVNASVNRLLTVDPSGVIFLT